MENLQAHYTVSISQAVPMVLRCIKAKLVTMMQGSPAIGKSAIGQKIAKDNNLKMIDLRLSQCDPTDLLGFPKVTDGKAGYVPMDTFPLSTDPLPLKKAGIPGHKKGDTLLDGTIAAEDKEAIPAEYYSGWLLFLDEFNSAPRSVQAAAYKIVLDRMVGQFNLHPNCAIMCAGNKEDDGAIVEEMSTALQSRLIHMSLVVNAEEWNDWAIGAGIDHRITSFINWKPDQLYTFKPDHTDKTYASPRTWEFADRLLKSGLNENDIEFMPLMSGTIGHGTTSEFRMFCEIASKLPTIAQIMANPDKIEVPDEPSILFALSGALSVHFKAADVVPYITFLNRLPAEFQIVTLKQTIARDRTVLAIPEVQDWCQKNSKKLF